MNEIDLTNNDFPFDRTELRKSIINIFLDELPGTGKGDLCSKYEYIVYKGNNNVVYLKRPAQFNNGFDFTIHVKGINFNPNRYTTRPTHQNIFDDLKNKKIEDPKMYEDLMIEIENIFNVLSFDLTNINFISGIPTDILCETIKWLFVEQDVTYWNFSGRNMFYNGILEI